MERYVFGTFKFVSFPSFLTNKKILHCIVILHSIQFNDRDVECTIYISQM